MKALTQNKYDNSFTVNFFLCLIMLGLPLVTSNGFYNITQAKRLYFCIIAVILLVAVIFVRIIEAAMSGKDGLKNRLNPKNLSFLDISMIAFGFFVFLSSVLSEYSEDVWFGSNSRFQGAVTVFLYIAVYFAVSRNYKFSQLFLLFSVASLSIVSILGVLNCFGVDPLGIHGVLTDEFKKDFISTIGNINFYSAYMCILFPLVLCGFCSTKELTSRIIYTAVLIIASMGMMVTGSESFVIGFVFSILVFPLFLMKDGEKLKKFLLGIIIVLTVAQVFLRIYNVMPVKYVLMSQLLGFILHPAISGVIIAICISVILIIHKKPGFMGKIKAVYIAAFILILAGMAGLFVLANTKGIGDLDKYFKITQKWGTYRGGIWMQCIDKFKEFTLKEKIFGIGLESLYHIVKAPSQLGGKRLDQAHNVYLQYLLSTGITGLLAYLSIIGCTVYTVVKKLIDNTFAVALLAGLIAYWFQDIVNIAQSFTTPYVYIYIAIIGGIYYNTVRQEKNSSLQGN